MAVPSAPAPGPSDATVPADTDADDEPFDPDLAPDSPIAWGPEYPWEAPADPSPRADAFMDDLDPSVTNPFPWTPVDDEAAPHRDGGG